MKLLVIALALYLVAALAFAGLCAVVAFGQGDPLTWARAAKLGAAWPWHLWRMFA